MPQTAWSGTASTDQMMPNQNPVLSSDSRELLLASIREAPRDRARRLYLASRIGQLQVPGPTPPLVRELLTLAQTQFGMSLTDIRSILTSVQAEMAQVSSLLHLDIGFRSTEEVLASARR